MNNSEIPEDPERHRMRDRLEGILARTERARAWGDAADPLRPLINRDGYVPIKTRLSADDLDLLAGVHKELLCFSELGLRLLDLHQPRDAGGITSDPAHPILRCRSCMWRWPCPTFRAMSEALAALQGQGFCPGDAALPRHVAAGAATDLDRRRDNSLDGSQDEPRDGSWEASRDGAREAPVVVASPSTARRWAATEQPRAGSYSTGS